MDEHIPNEEFRGRPCDFIVRYSFYTAEESGKSGTHSQGYRPDFMYEGDIVKKDGMYMIHPEFLDDHNRVILDKTICVPITGKAQMWILNENFFDYHKNRMQVGTKGFFMEGPHKTASCEVIELVRLK
ncbi:MAG: hypothetical protein V4615_04515 [Bacteroidota bacterium]